MIGSILTFLIVLSVIVLFHELGHFWVARRSGVWVEEFGFGLPPRVWGKKIGETIYSINLLPFGGFVRLHGESSEDGVTDPKRAFVNKSKRARVAIIMAGVVMNFILAFLAFSISYSFTGFPRETNTVKIVEIDEASPAEEAGLMEDDTVLSINGESVSSSKDFVSLVSEVESVDIVVSRDGAESAYTMVPRTEYPEGQGPLGVVISSREIFFPPWWQRPFYGVYYGFKEAVFWGMAVISGFASIFSTLFAGNTPEGLAGPVGIYAITTEAASFGIIPLINFVGILSVNLAILNAIPFPALDGGRLLFIVLEAILGKKVLPKLENIFHTVGMALLILLLIAITISDVRKLIAAGSLSAFIDSFAP